MDHALDVEVVLAGSLVSDVGQVGVLAGSGVADGAAEDVGQSGGDGGVGQGVLAGQLLSVAMLDVDGFTAVNDTLGHDAGDVVLREIAALVAHESRHADTLVRHGGDEFLLAMPGVARRDAAVLCERLRGVVELHDWRGQIGQLPSPTLSIGIADTSECGEWGTLVVAADARLLQAKNRGRNRVEAGD